METRITTKTSNTWKFSLSSLIECLESVETLLLTEDDLDAPRIKKIKKILANYKITGQFPPDFTIKTGWSKYREWERFIKTTPALENNPEEKRQILNDLGDMINDFLYASVDSMANTLTKAEAEMASSWENIKSKLKSNHPKLKSPTLISAAPHWKDSPIQAVESLMYVLKSPPSDAIKTFAIQFVQQHLPDIRKAIEFDIGTIRKWIDDVEPTLPSYATATPDSFQEAKDILTRLKGDLYRFFTAYVRYPSKKGY